MSQSVEFSLELRLIIELCKLKKNEENIYGLFKQVDWIRFINLTYVHGVLPLVYVQLKAYSEFLPKNELQRFRSGYREIATQNIIMSSELLKVKQLLEKNGIEVIAFKGPILSQVAYGDITLRQYADLDILINEASLFEAASLLSKSSYTSPSPITLLKDKNFLALNNDFNFFTDKNIHIEIHWKLIREKIALNRNFKIYSNTKSVVSLNGQEVNTLSMEMLLVYLSLHGSKHAWERIEWINDLYFLILNNKIIWEDVLEIAKIMECKLSLSLGLNLCKQLYGLTFSPEIEAMIRENRVDKPTQEVFLFLRDGIVTQADYGKYQSVNLFQLYLLDSKRKKIRHLFSTYFGVSRNDHLAIQLPPSLNALYYIIKPFRVLYKYLAKGK